ncbi:MAG: helix-turn-helix transcriptional regulator [Chitinophagaceae bacterium]
MPINKDALSRYRWIDERLKNRRLQKPTLETLIQYVSGKMGKAISERSIQKDIEDMRHNEELNYHAPIVYDRSAKVYFYGEEGYSINQLPVSEYDLQGLEIAISILEQFKNLPIIRQFEEALLKIAASLKMNRKQMQSGTMIQLDTPGYYKGLDWIPQIVEAMKNREIIRIAYQSFLRDEPKEHWVEPYHLREYNNRFYLVGKSNQKEGRILTFGLDRMVNIWETGKKFNEENFDHAKYFENVLGISTPEQKPEKIVLSFLPSQGKYIQAQPIHASQKLIQLNDKECRISLELVINHELIMHLLGYGERVKVLKPVHLAQKIAAIAQAMVNLYQPIENRSKKDPSIRK